MPRIVTKGFRRKLKLKASQKLVREAIQPQKQPYSQAKGVQSIKTPSNEP
jgi:hypothetical protein